MTIAMMVILLALGLFLIVAVLMQHGKSHGLSGTISGAAETFLGKDKGSKVDRVLARLTTITGILFVLCVVIVYIMQPTYSYSDKHQSLWQGMGVSEYYNETPSQTWVNATEAPTEGATEAPTEGATEAPTSGVTEEITNS